MRSTKKQKMKLLEIKEEAKYCKVCFKKIKRNSLYSITNKDIFVCTDCLERLKPHFRSFKIANIPGMSIFDYDESIQSFLFQLKGCYDYELSIIFLERYRKELWLMYHDFVLIPAPSAKEDDEKRQFNHVLEIFNKLGIQIQQIIYKTEKYKQSDHSANERRNVSKVLKIDENACIKNKKVLLVDDVFTTGSTLKAMVNLVKPLKPKKIKILVMSKTRFKEQ